MSVIIWIAQTPFDIPFPHFVWRFAMIYRFIVSFTFSSVQINQLVVRGDDYNELQTFTIWLLLSLTILMPLVLSLFDAKVIAQNLNSEQGGPTLDRSVADLAAGGTLSEVEELKLFGMNTDTIADAHVVFIAAQNGDIDGLRTLVKTGADFSVTNQKGDTPLMIAIQNDKVKAIEFMLSQNQDSRLGIDVNATNNKGITALMEGVRHNNIASTTLLLSQSTIDVNVANNDGFTAVTYGIMKERLEILSMLRHHGAEFTTVTTYGDTLLQVAAINNARKSITFLLDKTDQNQAISHTDERNIKNGRTALMDSVRKQDTIDVTKILLQEYNSNVHQVDNNGHSALHYAAINGNVDGIRLLLNHNADVNMTNKNGRTALMFSSKKQARIGAVKILLEGYDADANLVDKYGRAALQYAAHFANEDAVRLLLKHNVNVHVAPNALDDYGEIDEANASSATNINNDFKREQLKRYFQEKLTDRHIIGSGWYLVGISIFLILSVILRLSFYDGEISADPSRFVSFSTVYALGRFAQGVNFCYINFLLHILFQL